MFSIQNRAKIDRDIQSDINFISSAIATTLAAYDSIYLAGSFGRGEGLVRFDGRRWRGVNDYDFVVVYPNDVPMPQPFKDLGKHLARLVAIDFIDIMCVKRGSLRSLVPTIENYDLKYASLLLAGTDVRGEIPNFDPKDIGPYEFVRLLCNRAAGLLTTVLPERVDAPDYCANQYIKACIAVGDIAVYLTQGYHYSYQKRLIAFRSLIERERLPFSLSREAIKCVVKAYEAKLGTSLPISFAMSEELMRRIIQPAFCAIAGRCTAKPLRTIAASEKTLNSYFHTSKSTIRLQDIIRMRGGAIFHVPEIKNLILFSQPFFFGQLRSSGFRNSYSYFRRFWAIPGALQMEWSPLSAARLWEDYCH
jgi:hypothetical protein